MQIGWAVAVSTDAIAARMYPFIWLPAKEITHSQYNVLYALEVGVGILLGGYTVGWLSDKVGRRPMLIISSVLAGVFIWPFAYVTNYPALALLSIGSTFGIGGYLAINVVYMSEIMGPTVRPRVMMVSQVVCIFLLEVILVGLIPHYWFPSQYHAYLWLLAGLNILVAVYLLLRMPESPRWLEARERRDKARRVMERMEKRVSKGGRVALPEPDLSPYEVVAEEKTSWLAPFGRQYVVATVLLLVVMALGYAGIVYGGNSQIVLFLVLNRGYSAGTVFAITAWGGVVASIAYLINAAFGDRFERKWTQLFGAIVFAGGYWGMYESHSHAAVSTFFIVVDHRRHLVAVEHVRVHPQQLPDPDAVAGHRLDRRHRPPRRLGRRADRRAAVHGRLARRLLRVRHDPVRDPPGRPDRLVRQAPAPPRAGGNGPLAAGPPGCPAFPRCLRRPRGCRRRPSPHRSRPPAASAWRRRLAARSSGHA